MSQNKKQKKTIVKEQASVAPAIDLVPFFSWFFFALALLLYVNTLGHDYALDDVAVIQQNKFTKQGFAGIPQMLSTFYWEGYWDTNAGLYRPLSLITFAIEWHFFPGNPFICHLVNVLLYATICLLLFRLLHSLLKDHSHKLLVSIIAILIYTAHATHTEVVANIKSRDELLCLLTYILSLQFLFKYFKDGKVISLVITSLLFFLSLMSKEGAVAFVPLTIVALYFFTEKSWKEIGKLIMAYVIPMVIFLLIHNYVISHAAKPKITYTYLDNALVGAPDISSRVATAVYMLGQYLKLLVVPHPLSYDYSFKQINYVTWSNPQVLVVALICVLAAWIVAKQFKQKGLMAFSILLFFISFGLVSNIFMLIGATMADRFLFLPSLGYALLIGALLSKYVTGNTFASPMDLINKNQKIMIPVIIVAGLYSYKTFTRNTDWKNNSTLFAADVDSSPGSSRTQYNYGTDLLNNFVLKTEDYNQKMKYLPEIIKRFEVSVDIDSLAHNSLHNLGIAYYHAKNYPKAVQNFERSLSINVNDAKGYNNLGNAYYRNNQFEKAIVALEKSISLGFVSDDAYNFIGSSYFGLKNLPKAIESFQKALQKNPAQVDVLNNLASAYGTMGDYQNAINYFSKSLQYNPNNYSTLYFMAITYKNMGDMNKANEYLAKSEKVKQGGTQQ